MRTPISQLTTEQLAALPRVTRWRAQKRGWVCLDYHVRQFSHASAQAYIACPSLEKEIAFVVRQAANLRYPIPSYWDWDDVKQQLRFEMFAIAGKPQFQNRAFRFRVLRDQIKRIARLVHNDLDRKNYSPLPEERKRKESHES